MLTIYRRHIKGCPHKAAGRDYRRCKCPVWVDGQTRTGKEIRRTTHLRDWNQAEELRREWEDDVAAQLGTAPQQTRQVETVRSKAERTTLEYAWSQLFEELRDNEFTPSTIRKYLLLARQMKAFTVAQGLRYIDEVTLDHLRTFRSTWKDGPRSRSKKVARVRRFFRFAEDSEWITRNPARKLKCPRVDLCPTLPFSSEEMLRIISALDKYSATTSKNGLANARRLRGLVLLLRYSGMRIGDVVRLSVDKLSGNNLFLYTQKTHTAVYVPLPDFVIGELELIPRAAEQHFFWSGKGNLESCVRSWQTRLRKLFALAGIDDGHAHRFRDTFAVQLLQARVPIEEVSILLGHRSVRVTEAHYNPWVLARQQQLEADIQRALRSDPIALVHTKGTPGVHGDSERVN